MEVLGVAPYNTRQIGVRASRVTSAISKICGLAVVQKMSCVRFCPKNIRPDLCPKNLCPKKSGLSKIRSGALISGIRNVGALMERCKLALQS
jgi:hypothetical protein